MYPKVHFGEDKVSYKESRKKNIMSWSLKNRFTFNQRRYMTVAAFSLRMICMGVEYAVIFPSVWLYLKIFHVDYWYLGLVLSAYNMIGIISTVLVGHLADATRRIRFMGFLWNITEIAGNFVYSLHFHVSFPLIGRMVAGFGEGYISAMWGELARVTTKEQRTRYFTILKGSNLLGAALGPALNLFLKEFDFMIGEWHIDFRTSPGFFMGIVWIFVSFLMLIFVSDLSSEAQETQYKVLPQNDQDYQTGTSASLLSGSLTPEDPTDVEQEEKAIEKLEIKEENGNGASDVGAPTFKKAMKDMFLKFEVNVFVYLLFFMYVTHTCLQGITPLVGERMLKWSETQLSIVYTAWGLEIILVLIAVWVASFRVSDRVILLFAVICGSLSSITLVMLSYSEPESRLCLYSFLATILLAGVGISITVVVARSLVSKHTDPANQGLIHAILTAFNRTAGLTGPIFGSSLYTHKTLMGFLIGAVQVLGFILFLSIFKRLKPHSKPTEVR